MIFEPFGYAEPMEMVLTLWVVRKRNRVSRFIVYQANGTVGTIRFIAVVQNKLVRVLIAIAVLVVRRMLVPSHNFLQQ